LEHIAFPRCNDEKDGIACCTERKVNCKYWCSYIFRKMRKIFVHVRVCVLSRTVNVRGAILRISLRDSDRNVGFVRPLNAPNSVVLISHLFVPRTSSSISPLERKTSFSINHEPSDVCRKEERNSV
jgi:hypothetical protein